MRISISARVSAVRRVRLLFLSVAFCAMLAPAASGQTPGVVDNFDRPDAGSLGTATSGDAWTLHSGSVGLLAGRAAPGYGFLLTTADAGASDLGVRVTVAQPGPEFWLVVRLADASNYWRFGRWQGGSYQLQQIVNNSLGAPAVQTGASIAAQAGDIVSCNLRPALIECSANGVFVARTTNATGASATRVGLSSYQSDLARFDDFSATVPSNPDLSTAVTGPAAIDFSTEGLWLVTVANIGVSAMPSAEVVITPPASVLNLTVSGASCIIQGQTRRCAIGPVAPAQSVVLEVRATAPAVLTQLTFQATVASSFQEDDLGNNSGSFTSSTRKPLPAGARVFDGFDRPDGAPIAAETGQPWTHFSNPFSISGGTAAPQNGFVLSAVDSGDSSGDFTARAAAVSSEFWVVFRFSDAANYWRFGRWNNETYQLQRIQANYATVMPRAANLVPASGDELRCTYWLDQVECSVNGTLISAVSEPFNQGASGVGLSTWQTPTTRFDELLVVGPPPRTDVGVTISGPAMLRSGAFGSWDIVVRNRGTIASAATELIISPPAPLGGVGTTGAACTPQGGQYRCSIGALAAGATASVTLSGMAPATLGTVSLSTSTPVLAGEVNTADNAATHQVQIRPAIPAGALVVDLFDRPNSTGLGVADTGQAWTSHSPGIRVLANEAALESGFTLSTLNTGVSSADLSVTVAALAHEFWVVFRLSDTSNYWRFGRWQGGPYQLQQIRFGDLGAPALQQLVTVQPATGDQIACRVNTLGIDCSVNNVPVVRTADTFNRTATRVGFSGYQAASARFDDLVVVDQPTGPDLSVSVLGPSVALSGQPQNVRITVVNNGGTAASPTTLVATLPSAAQDLQYPGGCSVATSPLRVNCALSAALAPAGSQEFALSYTVGTVGPTTGSAQASLADDAFASDNSASWSASVEDPDSGIFDGFNRPDTVSGLGSTLTGHAWQTLAGGFRIAGGRALATTTSSLVRVDDGFAFGTLEVVLGDNPEAAGIAFRVVDANNYYRLISDGGFYRITKVVNGVPQDVQYYILRHATPVQPGDLVRVVSRPDDGMFVAVNGRHIIDAGDQQFMHATGWGLLSRGGTPSFRSFSLRTVIEGFATLDTFSGTTGTWLLTPTSGVNYHWLVWDGAPLIYDNGRARLEQDRYSVTTLDTSSELASTTVRLIQPGAGAWIVFRYVENGPYFRFGHDGGAYAVSYMSGVMPLTLPTTVQQFAAVTPAAGDLLEVRHAADGAVECFVNGVRTHRFVYAAGPGLRSTLTGLAGEATSAIFDDFTVTPLGR